MAGSSESLINKYGTWERVTKHIASNVKKIQPNLNEKDFTDWLMLHEHYSPSGYKRGLFGDASFYLHLYQIYKKMRSGSNQHHMILVSGKIGKGKSTLALQIAALLDPTFNMSRVCYVPSHFFRAVANGSPGQAIVLDEGGNFAKSRNSMTKLGRDMGQAFQLIRDLQQVIILCYDEPEKLDKELIDKVDSLFFKTYNPNGQGRDAFKGYLGFNVRNLDMVKPLLKKRLSLSDPQVLKFVGWRGYNNVEIPLVNDVSEAVYRGEKQSYLKDHMLNLANTYDEVKKDVEAPKDALDVREEKMIKYIRLPKFAKTIKVSRSTVIRWVKEGKLKGKKFENSWFVDYDSYIKQMEDGETI